MKFSNTLLVAFAPAALALPTISDIAGIISKRQDIVAITDQLLFGMSLPAFLKRRTAQDPPVLDWTSDGCTDSPDNPFGFPYVPACYRHDFGYQNFRKQTRFTQSGKLKIDNNFKTDLYYQCDSAEVHATSSCKALADVYYAAVRAFGGKDATPDPQPSKSLVEEDLVKEYEEKVAIYNEEVKKAQAKGELPILENAN
ncbi:Secretory phospholipase A2 [Cladobotryum mycophilum]|uniref:Secretory phospholipase A2 n=1 Tax=Cladobotryum mycophilum TaxID=491253 RepID=A0ABR0SCE8_9HYPO